MKLSEPKTTEFKTVAHLIDNKSVVIENLNFISETSRSIEAGFF